MLILIYAQLDNGIIGINNDLPWSSYKNSLIKAIDMAFFKDRTNNKDIVMGYKTWESLNFKSLKGRNKHYIITSKNIKNEDNLIYLKLEEFEKIIKENPNKDYYIIGGSRLFEAFYKLADIIYQSIIRLALEQPNLGDKIIFSPITNHYLNNNFKLSYLGNFAFEEDSIVLNKYTRTTPLI